MSNTLYYTKYWKKEYRKTLQQWDQERQDKEEIYQINPKDINIVIDKIIELEGRIRDLELEIEEI